LPRLFVPNQPEVLQAMETEDSRKCLSAFASPALNSFSKNKRSCGKFQIKCVEWLPIYCHILKGINE
jgi:hypothetical protein